MKNIFAPHKTLWLAAVIFSAGRAVPVYANPTGLSVASGSASARSSGSQLNVTVSQLAILNWQSFNIQNGETTTFLQPSANSVVFNEIGGANPAQIFGNLNANGTVILANANGFYFGPNSMVKVGGSFLATTASLPADPGIDAGWQFNGAPPLASIVNYGQITAGSGKSLFLIAENIQNHGSLNAPGGDVELAAGDNVLVSESADGRGLSATVQLPQGSVDNFGRITADAGTIALQAKVVNQNGILQADSIAEKNGVIELVASDSLNLGADSQILARGDDSAGGSSGGQVTLKSGNTYSDEAGSQIVTTGGANGGHGGNVEVSAPNIESLDSGMNAGAAANSQAGEFLLDPASITLGTTGSGTVAANGTVASGSTPSALTLNVNTAFANKNFSDIILQATGNITLNTSTTWNLSTSTGETTGQLTLEAGGNIIFNSGAKIIDANAWSVALDAGYNFANNTITPGSGNIFLNTSSGGTGSGSISTAAGNVSLLAGGAIQIGTGSVSTTGGNVTWEAGGDITFGKNSKITTGGDGGITLDAGYNFANGSIVSGTGNIYLDGGATVTPTTQLNGTLTSAGGDINLQAGESVLVGLGSVYTTGGGNIFAFAEAGNISAGNYNGGNGNTETTDYSFRNTGATPNPVLGGISTAAGGNVTLIAGQSVDSTPKVPSNQVPGASGTYGAGDVTVIAGGQITGNYTLADGTGTMLAGVQAQSAQAAILQQPAANPSAYAASLTALEAEVMQSQNTAGNIGAAPDGVPSTAPVTLGIINGSWNVLAANDISI